MEMIKVSQVKVPVFETDLTNKLSKVLKINKDDIISYKILKKSLDARLKPNLVYVYDLAVNIKNETNFLNKNHGFSLYKEETFEFLIKGVKKLSYRPIIVGAGPAGLFCGYMLAKYGYKPILIEQGESIERRVKIVNDFFNTGNLDEKCNIQFGEGGAGTFSDGKLNTMVKDKLGIKKEILKVFVECGAPEEILYLNKPHIGTDILTNTIINLRKKIISYGGEILFNHKMTDILIEDNKIVGIEINKSEIRKTSLLVLAIGHSARDTFYKMHERKVDMESKPFAVGLRVLHEQKMINESQYGFDDPRLSPADYKLTYNTDNRGVYSFCMCPGGYVVNSSSEKGYLVINGMSNHKRDSGISNSAIVITINQKDYGYNLFDGIKYQQDLEKKFFNLLNGDIPVQLYKDFKENKCSTNFKSIKPKVLGKYGFANIKEALAPEISEAFIKGMENFGTKIKGFNKDDTLIMGIESRTSSPIRIKRDEKLESNIENLYPCGEGAGYAGGIMTSAMDGVKVSMAIAQKFKP